jgi:endonuclease/exonuclease/phosphatase family metal-dependent hydrolase
MKRFLFALTALGALVASALPAAERESVTFCAYNLKNYLGMERFVNGARAPDVPKPEKEIAAVIRIITAIKPDALGVSEIGQEKDLRDLQRRLKDAGLDLPNFEYCHGGDPTRRLGLLTRLPIVTRDSQTELKYQIGDLSFPVQRGFLDATLRLRPGLDVRFIGVHLKSKRPVPEADESLMRRNEAHLLRMHLDKRIAASPEGKIVVYGDFNEHRHEAPIVDIVGEPRPPGGLFEMHLRDSRKETWTHYWKDADVYSRFDYIFFTRTLSKYMDRRGSSICDVPDYYDGSDHRPVVAKIWLTQK